MIDIERIKEKSDIVAIIEETVELNRRSRGKYIKGLKHDSLNVDPKLQIFVWYSKDVKGDVIEWLMTQRNMDFKQAVEYLADRAGITIHVDKQTAAVAAAARKQADVLTTIMGYLQKRMPKSPAAAYSHGRGWSDETVEEAKLGYWDGNFDKLRDYCKSKGIELDSKVLQAVQSFPANYLIYGHWTGGKCNYISGRAIQGKGHYNAKRDLIGERQVYWNHAVNRLVEHIVIVEGQADAISLAQWNVPAVALAGVAANATIYKQLERFERVYLGFDSDDAGNNALMEMAATLGPKTRIIKWPSIMVKATNEDGEEESQAYRIKDANEYMVKANASAKQMQDLLGSAPIYAMWLAARAAAANPVERDAAVDAAMHQIAALPEYSYEKAKKELANALGLGVAEMNGMRKALLKSDKVSAHKMEMTLPNGFLDGHLFEMVFDPDHEDGPRTAFAVRYPDGRISITRVLETDNYRILPLSPLDSILRRGFVMVPSGLADYTDEVGLQKEIQQFIHKYVDLPSHIEVMASYYVMMTWMFDKFYVVPYLRARGDSDSGKSRFTETVGHLCMRSIMITGATTPSPVFRLMEAWQGMSVVMDEADLPHTETSGDWTMMLNTGYKRGSGILRTNISNGEAKIEAFSAFGPKILNMRGRFPDDATESRCLTWETSSGRGIRPDIPRYMERDQFLAEAVNLRNKLLKWRLRNWGDVQIDYNQKETKDLPGRLVEITVSLMSISNDDEFKSKVMAFVRRMNEKAIMDRQSTLPAKVLQGLLAAYYLPDEKVLEFPEAWQEQMRCQVSHITRQTNRILNKENMEASLAGDEFEVKKEMSAGYIGKIIANDLNLEKSRATVGSKGSIVVWDTSRIEALIVRYGLEEFVLELNEKAADRAEKQANAVKAEQSGLGL